MKEFQRKKKIRRFLYSPLSFVILLIFLVIIGKATWSVYAKEHESQKNLDRATAVLHDLETRQKQLGDKIEQLKTSEGVETEIREQFQMAKPGEKMVVMVESAKPAPKVPEQSLVSRFFNWFK